MKKDLKTFFTLNTCHDNHILNFKSNLRKPFTTVKSVDSFKKTNGGKCLH